MSKYKTQLIFISKTHQLFCNFQIFYTYLLASLCAPVSYACNRLMVQYQPGMLEEGSVFIGNCLLGRAHNLGNSRDCKFICLLVFATDSWSSTSLECWRKDPSLSVIVCWGGFIDIIVWEIAGNEQNVS